MKTKIFKIVTGADYLILAIARLIGDKVFVNYCYSNSVNDISDEDIRTIDVTPISKWANKNNAVLWSY